MTEADTQPKPFAKLFDTPHGQLLAVRKYDAESDSDQIVVRGAAVDGVCPTTLHSYESEEAAERQFATIDQAKAERTAARLNAMVKGLVA